MKKQTILSVTQALLLSALSIPAIAQTIIPLSQQTNLNIAIYNQNIALVDDVRTVSLTQGINDISFGVTSWSSRGNIGVKTISK